MNGWAVAGAMALAILSGAYGYHAGGSDAEKTCSLNAAQDKISDQGFVIEKQTETRQEEQRRHDVVESVSSKTDNTTADTAASVGVSTEYAERLYAELEESKSRYRGSVATCDARIAKLSEAADAQYALLADLYRESDQAAGERAKEAESYRTAGLACEAIYDGIRNKSR